MKYFIYAAFVTFCLNLPTFAAEAPQTAAKPQQSMAINIDQTVVKIPIEDGISTDEAIESMILRANMINMKKVAHQPLYKELESLGYKNVRRTEIFQFCDVSIARKLLAYNIAFVAHMPCRIAVIEDDNKKGWLVMTNLDMFLADPTLPKELRQLGVQVRDKLMEIMNAGANGEL